MLNSIGVLVAAGIITIWPNAWYFDPLCTYFFSIITFATTIKTFGQCISTFLEATPDNIDTEEVQSELEKIPGVQLVHDLHLWSISQDKNAFTVRVRYLIPVYKAHQEESCGEKNYEN